MEFTCTDEGMCILDDNNGKHPVRTIVHNGSILVTPPPYIFYFCLSFICSNLNGYTRPFHTKELFFCVRYDARTFVFTMHDNVHQVDYRKYSKLNPNEKRDLEKKRFKKEKE